MITNRHLAPEFQTIEHINLPAPQRFNTSKGIPVFTLPDDQIEVLKLELIYPGGIIHQPKNLVSRFTSELITEGTSHFNSYELAEKIDSLGSYLFSGIDYDSSSLNLYSLSRNMGESLDILWEVLRHAHFPEDELETLREKKKQDFQINQNKVSFLAKRAFLTALFGKNHPYGNQAEAADYDQIQRKDLVQFFESNYHQQPIAIVLAGKIPPQIYDWLEEGLAEFPDSRNPMQELPKTPTFDASKNIHIEKEEALQTALRIGKISIDRNHPDYAGAQLLNLIYGGYFGSRLMKNIREEKAYTYGINSFFAPLKHATYWCISTEVGTAFTNDTIEQSFLELRKLQNEAVSTAELIRVKNYWKGRIQRNLDGVFTASDQLKNLLVNDLDFDHIERTIKTIDEIDSRQLMEIANRHWDIDELQVVTVGKKS